jgi:ADP-heptose:LPS heptosyltransferase
MINPEKLKVNPDRPYLFKSPLKIGAARLVDAVGGFFFAPAPSPVPWRDIKRMAVLRLDHVGDVLLALPALRSLEKALPEVQIDFFVGPWAKDLLDIAGIRSTPKIFAASWFSREGASGGNVQALTGRLREGNYDAVLELRGDFRHILSMRRAGVKYRLGQARTGLGFLLTHRLDYGEARHEVDRNVNLVKQSGIPILDPEEEPRLYPRQEDVKMAGEIRQKLGIRRPMIALHAASPILSKRWPISHWRRLIESLPEERDLVLIGTEGEKADLEEIQKDCRRAIFSTAGLLPLPALAAFLKDCGLLIGVDSGPAHIAAAVGTPVAALFSGTNAAEQWKPRGANVILLQKKPACSPCELAVCPIGHECMQQITAEEVLEKTVRLLSMTNR